MRSNSRLTNPIGNTFTRSQCASHTIPCIVQSPCSTPSHWAFLSIILSIRFHLLLCPSSQSASSQFDQIQPKIAILSSSIKPSFPSNKSWPHSKSSGQSLQLEMATEYQRNLSWRDHLAIISTTALFLDGLLLPTFIKTGQFSETKKAEHNEQLFRGEMFVRWQQAHTLESDPGWPCVVRRPTLLPTGDHRVGKFQGTLGRFYESFAQLLITHPPWGHHRHLHRYHFFNRLPRYWLPPLPLASRGQGFIAGDPTQLHSMVGGDLSTVNHAWKLYTGLRSRTCTT